MHCVEGAVVYINITKTGLALNAGELAHIYTLHVRARRGIKFKKAYNLNGFCRRPQNHKCSKTLLACIWIYRLSVLRVNSWPVT